MNQSMIKKLLYSVLLLCSQWALAQTDIKGTVTDAKGEPLLGATVILKERNVGVTTDMEGKFTIRGEQGQTLEVSYVGFQMKKVKITSNNLKITLQEETEQLGEVVVTGYQKIKSRVFTGASASVKMNEIKMDGVADVSRMLEGRVAGLSIQNVTGTFGSAPRINIRGGASIIGNVQPLWVIDGAVYEDLVSLSLDQLVSGDAVTLISSAIAGLNATDIQDIQVLKDASATSVYGARALNGVIVITTKSGKRDTPNRITYSYEQSFRQIPSYADFDLLNSQETMSVYQELANKGYFGLRDALYGRRSGIYYQWYKGISTINPNTGTYYHENTEEGKRAFFKEREYTNTDWFNHLFTLNPIQNHTITFSGGGKNTTTYASIGFYNDGGWTITDNVQRITANLKNTFYINDKFKTTLSAQGNMRQQKAPGTFTQRKNTTIGSFERDFDINPFSYALSTSRTLRPRSSNGELEYYRNNWAPFNILNEYQNNYLNINLLDFKIQGEASYKFNNDLEATVLLSTRQAFTATSHFIKEGSNVVQAFRANETPWVAQQNIYLIKDKDNPLLQPKVGLTHGGIFNKTETTLKSYQARFALDYNKQLGEHYIKGFGFAEIRSADRSVNPFQGYGIQYDKGNQIFTNPLIFQKLLNEGTDYFSLLERYERGVTFSLSGTYGYQGKYIFNTVLNYEGSNTAGRNSRSQWLPTWNIGGKWNIDQESFMKDQNYFSTLAFRASYGLTAKMNEQAINSNAVYKNQILNRFRFEDRENALRILHLENRDLTWEKMYELNIGIDAGFFNNRLNATIDVYQRNSFDLIDLIRTSGVGGQYYKYANFGDMRTRGVELALNSKNILTDDFKWTTNFTISYMNQEITRLLNTPNTFDMVAGAGRGNIVGFPKGSLFSFNYQGLNSYGLPTFDFGLYPLNNRAYGNIAGADFLDAQYSKTYLIYHGSIEPNVNSGLSNTFQYKNWELSFFITAQAGNKIRLNPSFDPAFADLNVFSTEYYNRWIAPGDEWRTEVPALPSQDLIRLIGEENIERAYNTYNYSQNRVADGSFVRMKNISLGYNVPEHYAKKFGLSTINVRGQVTNPFLIYSDKRLKGQDPEYYRSGGVSLPTPKQFTLTVNVGF
ncbi:SusC/RagA family TonB-linked outer membrane protein [Capnocytophaga catalasegens]|uniref:SusC/RagA family TonB-linked outer membrane protein n=1 Tax=Capnocytophaga catalasegens TaxID=1004260 RepID=A0AAV5AT85_9FLAO|nr:SusC/RagA family TonB-linked outer membrane protein [Capnocytophaga catalasegens]GIZ15334.1 SusC/RagA family TonB-linked outer membrane protein [Capnocytophaga catalasegens]GJM50501.1 SusC/RagA family TonB-linked outer membrane protein [Capnocytophaga catalasegens]GJM52105.1 SusC/RagA family TonB-linked outer membrane protein [Capnocytophaga catalasegens]